MGAKDTMLLYADGPIRPILQAAPPLDRTATRTLVERLYPGHQLLDLDDGNLFESAAPEQSTVFAGCFPGLAVVCAPDVALDRPSTLDPRFRSHFPGRTVYLHAMNSVVDWFAYAVWTGDGSLWRSLSLSPDTGVAENVGAPLAFEAPYWAGERPVDDPDDPYPLPFHPLELAEDALSALFGFTFEGVAQPDDPDPFGIQLAGYFVYRADD